MMLYRVDTTPDGVTCHRYDTRGELYTTMKVQVSNEPAMNVTGIEMSQMDLPLKNTLQWPEPQRDQRTKYHFWASIASQMMYGNAQEP
jgi:hypothetical protein